MDVLDKKLNEIFSGKVVRKDLVHQIKKAANVPSFVLEFLLSKYCATDDPDEIKAGSKAVLEVVEKNYVRADEANKAQSMVQQKGRHKFIDKIHVKYVESERRHWAAMENFNSSRIAINEKFYKENDKLLEGGIWAEVTIAHNDVEEDNYAFYVEDLKPIQLSRFNQNQYFEGREEFTRDEWIDVVLRSVGLNPEILDNPPKEIADKFPSGLRLKLHFLSRLVPLVQSNFNYIELGPRGTGKSYFYSEFAKSSYLNLDDLSLIVGKIIRSKKLNNNKYVFNTGYSDENYTKRQIISSIAKILPNNDNYKFVEKDHFDKRNYKVNFSKISNLNIKKTVPLKKGISKIIKFLNKLDKKSLNKKIFYNHK